MTLFWKTSACSVFLKSRYRKPNHSFMYRINGLQTFFNMLAFKKMSTFSNTFVVFSTREPERQFKKVNQIVSLLHLLRGLQWPITLWLISKIQEVTENLWGAGSSPSCFPLLPPHTPHCTLYFCYFSSFSDMTWLFMSKGLFSWVPSLRPCGLC